jgi:hypothetical protein
VFGTGGWIWVLANTDDSNGAPPETLFRINPATNEIVERFDPRGGDPVSVTASRDRIWFLDRGLRALDASTGEEVAGTVDPPGDYCCNKLVADGEGGVWVLNVRGGAENTGAFHVDASGWIDALSAEDPGDGADGIATAFDPMTASIWVVHYEDTVSRIQLYSP